MKYIKLFDTESEMNSNQSTLIGGITAANKENIKVKKIGQTYGIWVESNGSGYLTINAGLGIQKFILDEMEYLYFSEYNKIIDNVTWYCYAREESYASFDGIYTDISEPGTYNSITFYTIYEDEYGEYTRQKYGTFSNVTIYPSGGTHVQQKLNYTSGSQLLVSNTEILNVCGEVQNPDSAKLTYVDFPETVIEIKSFMYNSKLTSVYIPNSVTTIGDNAFNYCIGLTSITIPNSVTTIGDNAFYYCIGLTSITIPNSVTTIGDNAFIYCIGLTSITIPNSVTSIGYCVFNYCSGLTSMIVNSDNTVYDSRNNCNAIINTSTNQLISGCNKTIIPDTVTSIGNRALDNCTGLTGELTIPNSVTTINDYAFNDCIGLTSVTIGSGITYIGYAAFWQCRNVITITCKATTPPVIKNGTFVCSKLTTIYVPSESVDAYKSATNWSSYASKIQAISE